MPNDDISHPIPDTTGYITEGQLVLNRDLNKKGIYPPFEVLASISRLMKDSIGKDTTREDHADLSSQLLASYSDALEVRDILSVVGEDGLNDDQKELLTFGDEFERKFLDQGTNENRTFIDTFTIAWKVLSNLSKNQLFRIHQEFIEKFYTQ
jgi:V/A-type H+-transporting ATPase subunit B